MMVSLKKKKVIFGVLFLSVLTWILFKSEPVEQIRSSSSVPQVNESLNSIHPPKTVAELPPVSTAVKRPLKKKTSESDILNMASEDRLCHDGGKEFLTEGFDFKNEEVRRKTLLKSLFKANGGESPDPCAMALIGTDKIQSINWAKQSNSASCKTILALVLTDQMQLKNNPLKLNFSEMKEGLEILEDLQRAYPENGFYSFFTLYPLSTLKQESRLIQNLSLFLSSKYFEDPTLETISEIRELGKINGTSFVLSTEVYSSVDLPSYEKSSRVVKDFLKLVPAGLALEWSEKWLLSLESLVAVNAEEPFAQTHRLATFKEIAKKVFKDESSDSQKHPIFQKKEWIKIFRRFVAMENSEWIIDSTICSEVLTQANQKLDPFFQKYSRLKIETKAAISHNDPL